MVSLHDTAVAVVPQQPPVVAQLESVFANLEDAELLEILKGSVRRGPKGHSVQENISQGWWRILEQENGHQHNAD